MGPYRDRAMLVCSNAVTLTNPFPSAETPFPASKRGRVRTSE